MIVDQLNTSGSNEPVKLQVWCQTQSAARLLKAKNVHRVRKDPDAYLHHSARPRLFPHDLQAICGGVNTHAWAVCRQALTVEQETLTGRCPSAARCGSGGSQPAEPR